MTTCNADSHGEPRPIILGFFDVLGFSDRLEREGLPAIAATYDDLIKRAVERGPMRAIGLRHVSETEAVGVLFALQDLHAYFSDTILLWSELDQLLVSPFLQRCADFVCEGLRSGVPVRGVIALGEAIMDRERGVYLGQPIVEAAQLERSLGWAGCTFGTSCTWPPFFPEADPRLVLEYSAPRKDGLSNDDVLPVHLDWPRRWRETCNLDLVDHLTALNIASPHPYIDASIAFAQYSATEHDWFEKPIKPNAKFRMTRYADLPEEARTVRK